MKQKIAFLGLGAMGSRMAHLLLFKGFSVTGWNRSPRSLEQLNSLGLVTAGSPRKAVQEADIVISMVSDDMASDDVWLGSSEGAIWGMKQGAIAVECSTVSIAHSAILRARLADKGIALVEAPVVGSRPQAEAGQLIHLVGGEDADIEKVLPALEAMSGKIVRAGGTGAGAALKLLVNGLFSLQVSAVAELLALANALGLQDTDVERVLAATPVLSPAAQAAMVGISKKAFAPLFPINLVAKDMNYLVATASDLDLSLPLLTKTSQLFKDAARDGLGEMNITGIATRYT